MPSGLFDRCSVPRIMTPLGFEPCEKSGKSPRVALEGPLRPTGRPRGQQDYPGQPLLAGCSRMPFATGRQL